jgi:hypothetical protein
MMCRGKRPLEIAYRNAARLGERCAPATVVDALGEFVKAVPPTSSGLP